VCAVLQRLSHVHLAVLDTLVQHLNKLIDLANVKEADKVYINMLALSMGHGEHCPCVPPPPRTG
jgi:hypothetical protein